MMSLFPLIGSYTPEEHRQLRAQIDACTQLDFIQETPNSAVALWPFVQPTMSSYDGFAQLDIHHEEITPELGQQANDLLFNELEKIGFASTHYRWNILFDDLPSMWLVEAIHGSPLVDVFSVYCNFVNFVAVDIEQRYLLAIQTVNKSIYIDQLLLFACSIELALDGGQRRFKDSHAQCVYPVSEQ